MRLNLKINQKKQLPWLKESKKLLKKQRLPALPAEAEKQIQMKNFVKTQDQEIFPRMTQQQPNNNKSPTNNHFTKKIMLIILPKNQNKVYPTKIRKKTTNMDVDNNSYNPE